MKVFEDRTKNRMILAAAMLLLAIIFAYRGYPTAGIGIVFIIIYILISFIYVRLVGKYIDAEITGGDIVEKNEPISLEIKIKNKGLMPIFCCVRIRVKNRLTDRAEYRDLKILLPPKRVSEQTMTVSDELCGKITLIIESISVEDPLGIFAGSCSGLDVLNSGVDCYVAPQIGAMSIPADWLDSYNMESYRYSQHEKGNDPGEVFGIREYAEGDSPKQVHWKLTAKLGDMMVKIPSLPVENNILVILDNLMEPGTNIESHKRSRLVEEYCTLSASLADTDIPHSIGWYDIDIDTFCCRSIRRIDELSSAIPELLGCGFDQSDRSAVQRYIEGREDETFSNYFLVTGQSGRDTDRLESMGAVRLFQTE